MRQHLDRKDRITILLNQYLNVYAKIPPNASFIIVVGSFKFGAQQQIRDSCARWTQISCAHTILSDYCSNSKLVEFQEKYFIRSLLLIDVQHHQIFIRKSWDSRGMKLMMDFGGKNLIQPMMFMISSFIQIKLMNWSVWFVLESMSQ